MRDRRRLPFCLQEHQAVELIHEKWTGRERSTALAIYQSMTYLASVQHRDGGGDSFTAKRAEIAKLSGSKPATVDAYARELSSLGLVRVERRRSDTGHDIASGWTLTSPDESAFGSTSGVPEEAHRGSSRGTPGVPEEAHREEEGARGSSDSSLRPLKGAERNPPPPSPAARTRKSGDGAEHALARLPVALRPFVEPVREVLLRVADAKPGSYEPTEAAVAAAFEAYPHKDFLPLARDYEHWALHGRGAGQRAKDIVRQYRNWIGKEPDVIHRTPVAGRAGAPDTTRALRERLVAAGLPADRVEGMGETDLRIAEAEL